VWRASKETGPSRSKSQAQHTLRQLRQARGWTQQHVAEQLGATRSLVQKWETGKLWPRPVTRQRLADLFGVEVGEIAFGQDGQEQP
jgi:putative transcriptional regulator